MSFADYVKTERLACQGRRGVPKRLLWWLLVFCLGGCSAVLLCGCPAATFREVAKAAPPVAGGMCEDFARMFSGGARALQGKPGEDLPPAGLGSMATDRQSVTVDQVRDLAAQYGYDVEGDW